MQYQHAYLIANVVARIILIFLYILHDNIIICGVDVVCGCGIVLTIRVRIL